MILFLTYKETVKPPSLFINHLWKFSRYLSIVQEAKYKKIA